SHHVLGLMKDGRVLAAGDDSHGQCRTQAWRKVVAIAAGSRHSLGLRSDGSILTAGYDGDGQRGWTATGET
ncbi:chromosome condensation regulator, partial [Xanthomonas citri pv. citri]|nr:chromosome condensation regulator [Xanthomonas citri pv. citri]